jgi:hypothetical protein
MRSFMLALGLCLLVSPLGAHAGARAYVSEDLWMPPIVVAPAPPAEPVRATPRGVRERLHAIEHEVSECARTHLDATPRTLVVHVFVYPTGEWGIGFGRVRTPSDAGERGETPFEVCVADWVASSIGSHAEPFRGRRPRDVSVTYHFR